MKEKEEKEEKSWIEKWFWKERREVKVGDQVAILIFMITLLYTLVGFFVTFELGESGGAGWIFFIKLGIPFWVFNVIVFGLRRIRSYKDDQEDVQTQLAGERDDLKSRIERHAELDADYDDLCLRIRLAREEKKFDRDKLRDLEEERDRARVKKDNYYDQVLRPRKRGKLDIYHESTDEDNFGELVKLPDGEKAKITGIAELKKRFRDIERYRVAMCDMPFIASLFITFLFISFWVVANYAEGGEFGNYSRLTAVSLILLIVTYTLISLEKVPENYRAIWFFMGRAFSLIERGIYFVPKFLASVVKLPTTINWHDVSEHKVILTFEAEMQTLKVNISVPWWIDDMWDVISELGVAFKVIKELLQGKKADDQAGTKAVKGIIDDICNTVMRAFVADDKQVRSLTDALKMRSALASRLEFTLKEILRPLGIRVGRVQVSDVDPSQEVVEEINLAYAAHKRITRHEKEADALVAESDGKAKSAVIQGNADREVQKAAADAVAYKVEQEGEAVANALLAKLKANVDAVAYLKDKGVTDEQILSLITALLLGEKSIADVADALKGMDVNLFAIPHIGEFFEGVSSYFKKLVPGSV